MIWRRFSIATLLASLLALWLSAGICTGAESAFYEKAGTRYETERFRVGAAAEGVRNLKQYGDMCEETLQRLAPEFDPRWPGQEKIEVRVCTTPREFAEVVGLPSHTTSAVALPERGRMILNGEALIGVSPDERFRTVGHEMVHLLLGRIAAGQVRVPAWLHEGMAQTVTGDGGEAAQIRLAVAYIRDTLIPMEDLREDFPYGQANSQLAYAQSASFTRFVATKQFLFATPTDFFRHMLLRPEEARQAFVWLNYAENIELLETEWHHRSAGARNWFYIITSGTVVWTLVVVLFVVAYVRKRWKARRVMEQWDPWEREDDPWDEEHRGKR